MKKWNQPLVWGMIVASICSLGASYMALIGVFIGNSLNFVWCAVLLWVLYFYALYRFFTRPPEDPFIQNFVLILGILTVLFWGVGFMLICAYYASKTKAKNQLMSSRTNASNSD
ncbi:hypothetical protein [Klebsiella sp. 141161]|uniref:hypothetical protein n=1 Tax=Klebsiella sp. 141161 TaxID=3020037 RepID=UPI003D32F817